MSGKTKAIIAVIVIALTSLGYFFVNKTAQIEAKLAKIGAIAVIVVIIALAVAAIIIINNWNKTREERKAKAAAKKYMRRRSSAEDQLGVSLDFSEEAVPAEESAAPAENPEDTGAK